MRALLAGLLLAATPAAAQITLLPTGTTSAGDDRLFQICRAAVFYHLSHPQDPASHVPQSLARTLLDQINVVMFQTLDFNSPGTVEEGLAELSFTERWILDFSRVLREEEATLSDVAVRDAMIFDCVPVIWSIQRTHIEILMTWREKAIDAPPEVPHEEYREKQDALVRRLLTGE